MESILEFKLAQPAEANTLSKMASDSKKDWGYSEDLLKLWEADLQITEAYIKQNIVYKILNTGEVIGFYALRFLESAKCFEIDHLWLKPSHIHLGFGTRIFQKIISHLRELGQSRALLKADPNADGFYLKMGGRRLVEITGNVKGRVLPVYEFEIPSISMISKNIPDSQTNQNAGDSFNISADATLRINLLDTQNLPGAIGLPNSLDLRIASDPHTTEDPHTIEVNGAHKTLV